MKWLWILVMVVDKAHSICFVNTVVGEKGDVFDTSPALDVIHCKTICADSEKGRTLNPFRNSYLQCQSFNFHANICKLFSIPTKTFKCFNPYRELIKRTDVSECEDLAVTYSLSENYTPNPDLPVNSTTVDVNVVRIPPCDNKVTEIDAVLIDGTRKILVTQQTTTLYWNSKLGVWRQIVPLSCEMHLASGYCDHHSESGECPSPIPMCPCPIFATSPTPVLLDKATGVITCPPGNQMMFGNNCDVECANINANGLKAQCVDRKWIFSGPTYSGKYPSDIFRASCSSLSLG